MSSGIGEEGGGSTSPEIIDESIGESLDPAPVIRDRDVARQRESYRGWVAISLGIIFFITIIWTLTNATLGNEVVWANTKEALQVLLPVEASLLGSAVVFYFTSERRPR